jgi:phosphate acetyltransferase
MTLVGPATSGSARGGGAGPSAPARCLYVASTGPGSGKGLVALGLLELVSGAGARVGFFRPVVEATAGPDPLTRLVAERYGLGDSADALGGVDVDAARDAIAEGRTGELLTGLLERYKAVEAGHDVVVCLGSDFTGLAPALELDFNVELARNLGALLVPVVGARGRSVDEVADGVGALRETLEDRRCDLLAVVVNRVDPGEVEALKTRLAGAPPGEAPAYVIPELALLAMPTVGEIAAALGARWVSGQAEAAGREVADYKVAAMELPHFLDHLEEGSLVITPGDRSDIILGSLLADASGTYPRVAGLVLTGDLDPAPQVQRLLAGLARSPVPILSLPTDTFTSAMRVSQVEATLGPASPRKTAAALGLVEASLDADALRQRIALTRSQRVTPLMFEFELIQRAKRERQRIVLPEADDERVLRAAEILRLRDVVEVTLLGDPGEVARLAATLGLGLEGIRVVDPHTSPLRATFAETYHALRRHKGISPQMAHDAMADPSYFGTLMVYHGEADGMVSGAAHTTQQTIRPAFEVIRTEPGRAIVSSVFFMCLADRVLVYGDCAVNPNPDAAQLADIAVSSADTAAQFGVEPRVAMLSYSTGDSGKGEDVERVRAATRLVRERRPDLKVEGPIQYDAAVDAAVARSKLPGSEVAGHATVFVFPDLNTGNNTYKAVQRSAGAVAIGPVLQGLNKPVNDLSRGCTVTDIVNTVAITAIQAQRAQRGQASVFR